MKRHPKLISDTLEEVIDWIRFVTRSREEDIGEIDQINLNIEQFKQNFIIVASDETTDLTTGTKYTFRMPYGFILTDVRASLTTAATGGTLLEIDINDSGTTILSTKLTFDEGEKTTTTATIPVVISDIDLLDDAEITIDIDAIGSTNAGKGLKVYLIGYKS